MSEQFETNFFGDDETYMTKGRFEALTRIQKRDLDQVGIPTSGGIPLLATLCAFHKQFTNIRTALKGAGADTDLASIKGLQEHERLTHLQIKNQKDLGQLMEKDIAKVRVIEMLSGYQQMVQLFIKMASNQFPGDNRQNEELLTKLFNSLFERIEEHVVEVKEWEEDGSLRLLATRISESRKEVDLTNEVSKRTLVDSSEEAEADDFNADPLADFDKEFDVWSK